MPLSGLIAEAYGWPWVFYFFGKIYTPVLVAYRGLISSCGLFTA